MKHIAAQNKVRARSTDQTRLRGMSAPLRLTGKRFPQVLWLGGGSGLASSTFPRSDVWRLHPEGLASDFCIAWKKDDSSTGWEIGRNREVIALMPKDKSAVTRPELVYRSWRFSAARCAHVLPRVTAGLANGGSETRPG